MLVSFDKSEAVQALYLQVLYADLLVLYTLRARRTGLVATRVLIGVIIAR